MCRHCCIQYTYAAEKLALFILTSYLGIMFCYPTYNIIKNCNFQNFDQVKTMNCEVQLQIKIHIFNFSFGFFVVFAKYWCLNHTFISIIIS